MTEEEEKLFKVLLKLDRRIEGCQVDANGDEDLSTCEELTGKIFLNPADKKLHAVCLRHIQYFRNALWKEFDWKEIL